MHVALVDEPTYRAGEGPRSTARAIFVGAMLVFERSRRTRTMNNARGPKEKEHMEELVDEANDESFPASDPPFWTLGLPPRPSERIRKAEKGKAEPSPPAGQQKPLKR